VEFSGEVARQYAAHRRGFPPAAVDALVGALGLPADATVLDLGCGTGQLTVPLAGRYARVIGADPSPDMLALARAGAPAAPVAWLLAADADVGRLPLLRGLDAVTIATAVHLLDRPALFAALAATMSARGRVAVVTNGGPLWLADVPWSRALNAYLSGWLGVPLTRTCGTDPAARAGHRAELAAAGFPAAVEVRSAYEEEWTVEGIAGNVCSALSPGQLPADRAGFEAGLRAALAPHAPYRLGVEVVALVAARG
jgi:SAM-dependent methyltransferase